VGAVRMTGFAGAFWRKKRGDQLILFICQLITVHRQLLQEQNSTSATTAMEIMLFQRAKDVNNELSHTA
jgi:hypothetical protein